MAAKKAPRQFYSRKKTTKVVQPSTTLKKKTIRKVSSARSSSLASSSRGQNVWQKLRATSVYPDFSDLDDLVRFAAYFYLLALTPLLTVLIQSVNTAYSPGNEVKIQLADKSLKPEAAVLGQQYPPEQLIREQSTPSYPLWQVEYSGYTGLADSTAADLIEAEVLEYRFDEQPLVTVPMGVSWRTLLPVETADLYTFYVAAPATARVYVDGLLLVEKINPDVPSAYNSVQLEVGKHEVRVELDATPQVASFQFLFY